MYILLLSCVKKIVNSWINELLFSKHWFNDFYKNSETKIEMKSVKNRLKCLKNLKIQPTETAHTIFPLEFDIVRVLELSD